MTNKGANLQLEAVAIATMKPAKYNPRKISRAQLLALTKSLEEFGSVDPIILNKDSTVIGGHQRITAAKSLGWTELPAIRLDLNPEQERILNLALNRIAGEWHEQKLAELLAELEDGSLALTGFDDDEIEHLLKLADKPAKAQSEEDAVGSVPKKPKSKLGDMYYLGEHRLLCGDATDTEAVDRVLAGEKIGLTFTDPPYGVSYQLSLRVINEPGQRAYQEAKSRHRRTDGLTVGDNDALTGAQLHAFLIASLGAAVDRSEPGAAIYVCSPSGDQLQEFLSALRDLGVIKQTIVWVKDAFVMGRQDLHYRHEMLHFGIIAYGWKSAKGGHRYFGDRREDTVWEIPRPKRSAEHPTMKPVELVRRAIKLNSVRGDLVYDPFGGSGTTLIAAEATGRRCATIELDPGYTDVIVERWENYTGQKATREGDTTEGETT